MRIAVLVASVVVANVITFGGIAAVVLTSPQQAEHLVWLAVIALTAFIYGPLMLGSLASYWDVRGTPESWRYFRWWFTAVYALQLVGVVAIIVFSVLAGPPLWLPVVFIAVAVLLNLVALPVARGLYKREEARRSPEPAWHPVTRQQIARKILIVTITFIGLLVVGAVGFTLLFSVAPGHHHYADTPLLFAAEFAFIGSALACIAVTLQLNRQLRENVSRDLARLRKVAKVVLRNKPLDLDADEQVAAAKYAALISVTLPFTLAYTSLLYVGISLQQVQQLQTGIGGPLPAVLLALFPLLLVVIVPLYVHRMRRARAYAARHRPLLPQPIVDVETPPKRPEAV